MKIPHTLRDSIALLASLVFTLGGAAMVAGGEQGGWSVLFFFGLCTVVLAVAPFFQQKTRKTETVEISDWGVRRTVGKDIREAVSWQELLQVSIETTSDGPAVEDVFFLLHGSDNSGVVVPHSIAVENGLLEVFQKKLPGFDNRALVEAMGSTTDQVFVVWRVPEAQRAVATDRPKTGSG